MLIRRLALVVSVAAAAFAVAFLAGREEAPARGQAPGHAVVTLPDARPAVTGLRRRVPAIPALKVPSPTPSPTTTAGQVTTTAPTATATPPPSTGTSTGAGTQTTTPTTTAQPTATAQAEEPPPIVEESG